MFPAYPFNQFCYQMGPIGPQMGGPGPRSIGQMGTGITPGPGPSWYIRPEHWQVFSGHPGHPSHHRMGMEESESSLLENDDLR